MNETAVRAAVISRTHPQAPFFLSLFLNALFSPLIWLIIFCAGPIATLGYAQSCGNPVACENMLPGNPGWDISGSGDSDIQGFATDISVNAGDTVNFKISTNASNYHLDIYRMGYYSGAGARKLTTITPSATLPQIQPACLSNASTGLVDCGNWGVSASWTVPFNAVSGLYFADVIRPDNGHVSQIFWVVRNDASHSDILYQTSDQTWVAYNDYGGHSLYGGAGTFDLSNRAFKVSYNRPFHTRSFEAATFLFNGEYPMIRWLEANGYDVSYFTGVDAVRHPALITNHKLYLSVGHDEYVSTERRANIEAARNSGVNMAFFSGNEIFWKTRWENSIDGSNTPLRTEVCYKETYAGTNVLYQPDPQDPPTFTGTWRDPRFSPPGDGGRPENALSGTIFEVNGPGSDNTNLSIQVPAADGKMRFWRNTSVASLSAGQTATLPGGTLGYEWDADLDNGFRPAGLIPLSTSTYPMTQDKLLDYGGIYGAGNVTHHLTLYRAPSGALVFGAGTVQWAWGLDSNHDGGSAAADIRMQQATLNLFADMGIQPATMQPGLVAATKSTDTAAPTATITSPSGASSVPYGSPVTISGTATDTGGGVVGAVEVSVDGAKTWHPATGRGSWTYTWTPSSLSGSGTIMARAVDDSGNLQNPPTSVTVPISGGPNCPCTIWPNSTTPGTPTTTDTNSVELGLRFRSDVSGTVTGIRFYKGSNNTGTHVGNLWTNQGSKLATVTFTNETSTGWQQANFSSPVPISANTTYVISYFAPNGGYADDEPFFAGTTVDRGPLHALYDGQDGPNGAFLYSSGGGFPTNFFASGNYWVDVVFTFAGTLSISGNAGTGGATVNLTGSATMTTTADSTGNYSFSGLPNGNYTVTPSKPGFTFTPASAAVTLNGSSTSGVNFTAAAAPTWSISGAISPSASGSGATVNLSGTISATATADASGNYTFTGVPNGTYTITPSKTGLSFSPSSQNVTISGANVTGVNFTAVVANSIWSNSTVPGAPSSSDTGAVELGLKFRSDVDGFITGVRFYKGSGNIGTHVGHLWTTAGANLATVTFTGETASGWQQASFPSPVAISANTTYVISYFAPSGHYAADANFFATSGVDTPPLHALSNAAASGNGVYLYSASGGFPSNTFSSTNYWVDVVFAPAGTGSISGNAGTSGATVTLSGAGTGTITADSSGNYSFTGLANGNYTVTPSKSGFSFTPPNAAVTVSGSAVTGVNFTATAAPTWSISGTITGGAGSTVTLSGAGTGTVTADASGNYTFTGLANGNYTVTPSKSGLTFTPPNAAVTVNGANVTGVNFTAGTAPTWSISGTITPAASGSGATVSLSGTATATATADSSGNYTFTGLLSGSYTITPSKTGLSFSPVSQNVTINGANVTGVNFTAAAASSIWSSTTVPSTPSASDSGAVELGLKFRSDVAGSITGIRFYKGTGNTGTHVGNLWTTAGANLGTLTFTGETVSGWQQANFSSPIAISANTTYVISYFAPNGHYAADANFFATSGVDSPPLHALSNTAAGGNGVYLYSASGGFPSNTFNSSNYWVDVVFAPAGSQSVSGNAGTGGATVTLSGAATATVTADSSGNYTFTGLANGNYTITPTKSGFSFSPANAAVTVSGSAVTGVNFTATASTFSISGTISGGAGATVTLSGGGTGTTTADASGNYSFTGLANGNYTVTPSKAGLTFAPANATVTVNGANITGVNFTATTSTWSISGTITGGAGATVTLSGAGTGTTTADASGNYTFNGLANGNYTVTPSQSGVTFTPANAAVTVNGANVTGVNFSASGGTLTWSISGTITGGASSTVTLTGAGNATATADSSGNYTFTGLVNGNYTVTPSKTGFTFNPASASVTVNGANVTGVNFTAKAAIAVDAQVFQDQGTASTTVSLSTLTTTSANELLLAFVATDQLSSVAVTVNSIAGAGLTWTLVKRTNTQSGTSEIWRAFAPAALTNATVTATLSQSVASSMTIMSFQNVDTSGTGGSGAIGATGSGSASSGAPTASLMTTRNNSWVMGVGNDFDNAIARTPGAGQTLVHQYLTPTGDTYWVQRQNSTTPPSGTVVTINDTAPTGDRYNLAICEILQTP